MGGQYGAPITVSGGVGADMFSVTGGSLPDGITLDPNTGDLAGSPTSTGTSEFTVSVTDSNAPVPDLVSEAYSLTTDGPNAVSIPTVTLPDATQGASYLQTLYATGGTAPYSWMLTSGSLPEGVSLDPTSGDISGAPTSSGTFDFTVQVTDSSLTPEMATEDLTLTSDPGSPLAISTSGVPAATEGTSYDQALDASGGTQPLSWQVSSGVLPPGLNVDPASGSISGIPTSSGVYSFTVQASDASTPIPEMAFEALSLEVEPPLLSVSTTALSSSCNPSTFGASVAFSATVSASAGVATTATGRITFYEGTTPVGTRLLSAGSASVSISTLSVGTHDVTAEYSGDDNFTASISSTITQIVSHSTSSTVLASSTNPSIAGRAVTLRATVRTTGSGKPSGTVTFYDGTKVLGRVKLSSTGTATFTTSWLPVGKDRITARYSGSSSYGSSTSAVLVQKVKPS
jgi:hypothetical protein